VPYQLLERLPENLPWLEHAVCGEPLSIPLYHSRQDGPHEDYNSSDAEDYEGHIGTWTDPDLSYRYVDIWIRGWGLSPLLDGPLAW
jgi:hypothetical protein